MVWNFYFHLDITCMCKFISPKKTIKVVKKIWITIGSCKLPTSDSPSRFFIETYLQILAFYSKLNHTTQILGNAEAMNHNINIRNKRLYKILQNIIDMLKVLFDRTKVKGKITFWHNWIICLWLNCQFFS